MQYLVALVLSFSGQQAQPAQDLGPVINGAWSRSQIAEMKVSYLFDKMETGQYGYIAFPKYIGPSEIPELLRWSGKELVLHSFPINPASSQRQAECTEGMVALWLVEGIRKGGKFPSNNPLCTGKDVRRHEDWQKVSELRQKVTAAAYGAWWSKVKALPWDKAAETDPLAGTGYSWH